MSGASSNEVEWLSRLDFAKAPETIFRREDDPRVGECVHYWRGEVAALQPGRPVLIGFPQDDGVRRNRGRVGAAEAPHEIRRALFQLSVWDPETDTDLTKQPLLDLGSVKIGGKLEETQQALAQVVAAVLQRGAVPIILGGGHETAFGHYLGYAAAGRPVGIVNIDAHLDVRPCSEGHGNSGSAFRQALEHADHPLPGSHYVCLGAQPHHVSRDHVVYAKKTGCVIRWCAEVRDSLDEEFARQCERLAADGCSVYLSVDADAVRMADVPGVSAPNVAGLCGESVLRCARLAGQSPQVSSLDLVEINPRFDQDGQSARWGALLVWHFLVGLHARPVTITPASGS